MAFSYSDKNFTVIGNLCFVHIFVSDKNEQYEIPPAIADRMLVNNFMYPYLAHDGELDKADIGIASFSNNKISFYSVHSKGYLICLFPIDSNK